MTTVAAILKHKGRSVTTARLTDTVRSVAEQLALRQIGAVVVVRGDGKIAGIVSERDIVRGLAEHGPDFLFEAAEQAMTRAVVTCTESVSLDALMTLMTERRFRHVPVVADDKLIGIVSIGDVVKSHIAEVEHEATALRDYIAAH